MSNSSYAQNPGKNSARILNFTVLENFFFNCEAVTIFRIKGSFEGE